MNETKPDTRPDHDNKPDRPAPKPEPKQPQPQRPTPTPPQR